MGKNGSGKNSNSRSKSIQLQGKSDLKSQKQKSNSKNKTKGKNWVDVKIQELDASLTQLRKTINVRRDQNTIDNKVSTSNSSSSVMTNHPIDMRPSNNTYEPSTISQVCQETLGVQASNIYQTKPTEEYLMPITKSPVSKKIPCSSTHVQWDKMRGCCKFRKQSMESTIQTAGIIIIGDEILKGQVQDVNSHFICKHLYSYGIKVPRISVIGDGVEEIATEVKKFSSRFDYVLTTGGIGPTHDDMTYVGIAKAFGERIILHPDLSLMADKWFANQGYEPDVIRKMAELPASAKLIFDPNLPPMTSFPIVNVKNVYIFPGIPQFVEKIFPIMVNVFRKSSGNNLSTTFHNSEIYVTKDELSITNQINKAVKKFEATVTFGSYPVVDNVYFKTRITMESLSREYVQDAKKFLSDSMPENTVLQNYDSDPVSTAAEKVYTIANNESHELHKLAGKSVKIIEEAIEKYGAEGLYVCFNGGKDCTALLHLVHAVIQKQKVGNKYKLQGLYIRGRNTFPEMEAFVQDASSKYNLELFVFNGPIKDGLTGALNEHSGLKGVFMGTRRSDPSGASLDYFKMTDPSWPQIMRISPMLDWSFSDVWTFLRTLTLPYCQLYDRGYTSIGDRNNTMPNPALAIESNDGRPKYRPAYTLNDPDTERTGRQ